MKNNSTLTELVLAGYLTCAKWADGPENSNARFPRSEVQTARETCAEFVQACGPLFEQAIKRPGYTPERFGHDFWLTRCGHGAGFWDRDELMSVPPFDGLPFVPLVAIERDGKEYPAIMQGDELGDVLSRIAYGDDKHISKFANYSGLTAYRGWLYF